MNDLLIHLTANVLRSSALLMLMAGLVAAALHLFRIASPTTRRIAYLAVVAQGCLLARLNIELPILDAAAPHVQHESTASDQMEVSESTAVPASSVLPIDEAHKRVLARGLPAILVHSPRQRAVPWTQLFAVAWAVGVILLAGRALWNYCRFWLNPPRELHPEPEWLSEWDELQRSEGVGSPVPLYVTEHAGPMLCRLPGGYRLIVPAHYWSGLQPQQRLAILRHELAHLLRGDVWKSLGIRMLALLQWFNPAVWWAVNRFEECAEWACDEAAKTAEPEHVADYARALLSLGNHKRAIVFSSPAVSGSGLSQRIHKLLSQNSLEDSKMKKITMLALVAGVSLIGVLNIDLTAEEATSPKQASSTDEPAADSDDFELGIVTVVWKSDEATVDMTILFEHDDIFRRDRELLQDAIEQSSKESNQHLKTIQELSSKLEKLKKEPESKSQREDLNEELAVERAGFEARRKILRQRFLRREGELYQKVYNRIQSEVAAYAKENGIRVVRRLRRSQDNPDAVTASGLKVDQIIIDDITLANGTRTFALAAPATGNPAFDGDRIIIGRPVQFDPQNPREIIKRMNQEVVYNKAEEASNIPDITEEIQKRLKAKTALTE